MTEPIYFNPCFIKLYNLKNNIFLYRPKLNIFVFTKTELYLSISELYETLFNKNTALI